MTTLRFKPDMKMTSIAVAALSAATAIEIIDEGWNKELKKRVYWVSGVKYHTLPECGRALLKQVEWMYPCGAVNVELLLAAKNSRGFEFFELVD